MSLLSSKRARWMFTVNEVIYSDLHIRPYHTSKQNHKTLIRWPVQVTKTVSKTFHRCRWKESPMTILSATRMVQGLEPRRAIFWSSTASCSEKLPLLLRLFSTWRQPLIDIDPRSSTLYRGLLGVGDIHPTLGDLDFKAPG